MEIEFDPDKDESNRRKHGLSLADAAPMDFDTAFYEPDIRRAYGEARFQAHGLIGGRLHARAFDVLWAISLRKANTREVKRYGG